MESLLTKHLEKTGLESLVHGFFGNKGIPGVINPDDVSDTRIPILFDDCSLMYWNKANNFNSYDINHTNPSGNILFYVAARKENLTHRRRLL